MITLYADLYFCYSRRKPKAPSATIVSTSPKPSLESSGEVSSPPTYRRFSSPRPPRFPIERKMSAGILRIDTTNRGKSSGSASVNVEPTSPAPSVDRLSVTFAMDEQEKVDGDIEKTEESLVKNEPTKGRIHLKFDF